VTYRTVLGAAFDALHPHVQEAHTAPLHATGTMDVVHGAHRFTRVLAAVFRLPAAGRAQAVTLDVTEEAPTTSRFEMRWNRVIGNWTLRSRQTADRGLLIEQHWPARIAFALREDGGSLVYEQRSIRVMRGPLWSGAAPQVRAEASPAAIGWHVVVEVSWRGHLICRYAGEMARVGANA